MKTMPSSSDRSSDAPVIEVGEEDIVIEESWLDREWAELLESKAHTRFSPADGAPAVPILAAARSTAHAILACTMELEGLVMAATLEAGVAHILIDRSERDRGGEMSALADLWKSCSELALGAGAPVEELVIRNGSTIVAYRRVAGTSLVLCALVDRAETNDALVRMNLKRLCG